MMVWVSSMPLERTYETAEHQDDKFQCNWKREADRRTLLQQGIKGYVAAAGALNGPARRCSKVRQWHDIRRFPARAILPVFDAAIHDGMHVLSLSLGVDQQTEQSLGRQQQSIATSGVDSLAAAAS
jgi:hypothetical protein